MSNISAVLTGSYGQSSSQELSRLISAAVINERFCKLLLANPSQALSMGFSGEKFHLKAEERDRISAIRASSLSEFAAQLSRL